MSLLYFLLIYPLSDKSFQEKSASLLLFVSQEKDLIRNFFRWRTRDFIPNKAGYSANLVVCGWAGAMLEKVTRTFGQEQ